MGGVARSIGTRLAVLVLAAAAISGQAQSASTHRHLLIVVDGLRPDYVTERWMPNLTALGRRGVVFTRHHSVFPALTRVNAASFATGAYPGTHGLMANRVFFPGVDPRRVLDTASPADLNAIAQVERRLLTAPTLGEWLQAAGRRMLVASSGSGGAAILNNPTLAGGAILHPQFTIPESLGEVTRREALPAGAGLTGRDARAVDLFLKVGLPRIDPSVTVLWLGGLDTIAHAHGIGARETMYVLRGVDAQIKRIEDGLRSANLFDAYNIWVASDHGFSTHLGFRLGDVSRLLAPFEGTLPDGSPRLVAADGAIYVRDHDPKAITGIVDALQRSARAGAIFTRGSGDDLDGGVPGTLSLASVRWDHPRSAQILYSPDWSDTPNAYAFPGTVRSGGDAGHISSSPWDIHGTAIAAGPDLKRGVTIDTPSANVDFAPTFLKALGIAIPPLLDGRALTEALADGPMLPASAVRIFEHTARTPDGRYSVTGSFSIVTVGGRDYRYFDSAKAARR